MAEKKSLPVEGLIELLLQLERSGAESTLAVARPGAVGVSYLRLERGQLVDLVRTAPPSLLTTALAGYPGLRERDRRRAQKQADHEQRDLGEIILESRLIPDEDIPALILAEVERQFAELLQGGPFEVQSVPPVQASARWRSIGDYFHLAVPISNLLVQAARQLGNWRLVAPHLPLLKEVLYATPQSLQVLEHEAERPLDAVLVRSCDGRLELGAVIEGAGGDPFAQLVAVERLQKAGCLGAISAVQLFQLACEAEQEGDLERARRRFERAEERGLDDFDLGFRLAEVYCALGLEERAIDRFLAFAEKCVGQFRIDDTIRACRRVIQIDPNNLPIYERYVSLLARYGKAEEALAEASTLARRFQADGATERARATLEKVLEHASANEEVLRTYHQLCEACGHTDGAHRALGAMAELHYQRNESDAARELFQQLFVGGTDSITVRMRLAELHLAAGNTEKANEHLLALQQYSGWSAHAPGSAAREFFRRLLGLDQRNPAITQWLMEEARSREDPIDLLRVLKLHCARLQALERFEEARTAAEEISRLAPDDTVAVRRLAELERRCGHPGRAVSVLEELALRLKRSGDEDELRRIVEQILGTHPLSLVAREIWQESLAAGAELPLRVRRRTEGQLLDLARGVLDGYPPPRSTGAALERALGMLALHLADLRGATPLATEIAHWLGRSAAEQRDFGTLQEAILRLEKLAPEHADLPGLRLELEQAPAKAGFASNEGPLITRISVSNITSRLKGLRGSDLPTSVPTPATRPTPPPQETLETHSTQPTSGTKAAGPAPRGPGPTTDQALPTPTQPGAPRVAPAAQSAAAHALPDPAPPRNVRIGGALSRLKALKGGPTSDPPAVPVLAGGSPMDEPLPTVSSGASARPFEEPAPLPPPSTDAASIQGSLARLRNLKGKGGQAAAAPVTSLIPGVQEGSDASRVDDSGGSSGSMSRVAESSGSSAPAGASSANPDPVSAPEEAALPPPKPGKELGSAASRLNSLRNKATR